MATGTSARISRFKRLSRKPLIAICGFCAAAVAVVHLLEYVNLRKDTPLMPSKPLMESQLAAEDFLQRSVGRRAKVDPELVFLAMDTASVRLDHFREEDIAASPALQMMQQEWPWPRAVHVKILERLMDAGAKVVVIDVLFPSEREGDEEFRAALDRYRDRVVIGCNFGSGEREKGGTDTLELPSASLIDRTAPLDDRVAFVNFWPDTDSVIRHGVSRTTRAEVDGHLPAPDEEVLDSLAAKALKKSGRADAVAGDPRRRIRLAGPMKTFRPISVCDLFDERRWNSPDEFRQGDFFRGKIVVLGAEGNSAKDEVLTPMGFMGGPELHLNAINAGLQGEYLRSTSRLASLWFIGAGGVVALMLCYWARGPLLRLGLLVATCAGWVGAAILAYGQAGLFIPTVGPLVALASGGVACLGWDFFLERRDRVRVRSILDRYVAKNVVELVVAESDAFSAALKGQRRYVATLFSDIRGFTTMTEESDPEELVAQLNEYFFAMVEGVLAEGGTLQDYIGDAIMAVWGDTRTLSREESAFHGVRTALLMETALVDLNRRWASVPGRRQFEIGIGINQGDVVVGSLGHPMRLRFAAVGDGINTAARLETATKHFGCRILVGETVESVTRGRFHYRRVDRVRFKGKGVPIEVYTPLGDASSPVPPWLDNYEQAVTLYRERRFAEAAGMFQAVADAIGGEDALCRMYLGRCEHFAAEPPEPDWDGSYTMSEK
ncbi:CHASE2 domain-containing protein [Luteolibacter arcticus]|uniref:CHASE2 domain-containing protein n=1 Tax=Luteolibacter arcticus TaxID=1581411 RepID=UPI002223A1AA|nr:adenylate/guanylate cyclase domain-containing protein [Luteolibacter arcticus]